MKKIYIFFFWSFFFILNLSIDALSFDLWDIKRRKNNTENELGYFFYPLIYTVPGVGSGNGLGGTILNLLGEGSTLNLIRIRGDYDVDAVATTGIPIFTPRGQIVELCLHRCRLKWK